MRRIVLVGLAVLAGCGGDEEQQLTVSAATSLTTAFEKYGERFDGAEVRFSFAGSDELAAQIRQGARPDVFAAANTKLPQALADEGLLEEPVEFTRNSLVLAVPAEGDPGIESLADAARPGVTLAIGNPEVPVGAYARTVIERLPAAQRSAIEDNIRTEEPDVGGIVGKLTQGAVDAGFVYVTDVQASSGKLRAIDLPPSIEPDAVYAIGVVKGADADAAAEFVEGVVSGAGQGLLREAGFRRP